MDPTVRLSFKTLALIAVLVACAGALSYHNALGNGVTNFDDQWQVIENPLVQSASGANVERIVLHPYHGTYLPVKLLSYMADYLLYGALGVDVVYGLHLTNVVLHILNSILVAVISLVVVADLAGERLGRLGVTAVALFAGVLFVVHPVHVESVAWLSSRKDVLSFFFMALAFLAFRGVALGRGFLRGVLCVVLFALALGSKNTVLCFPLIAGTYWFLISRKGGTRAVVVLGILCIVAVADILLAAAFIGQAGYEARPVGGSYLVHYLTLVKTFPFYMRILMFPVNLCVIYGRPVATGLVDAGVWWGAVMILAQLGVAAFVPVKTARFIVLWYLLALVPVMQIIPVAVPALAADRYAYVASVPFALAPALIAWNVRTALLKRGAFAVSTALVAACVVYAGVLGVGTWSRNRVWRSSKTLWRDCLTKSPNSRTALVNLGVVYFDEGNYPAARDLFERVVRLDPFHILGYYRLGLIFEKADAPYSARAAYMRALTQPSSLTDRYTRRYRSLSAGRMASMALAEGRYQRARTYAAKALQIIVSPSKAAELLAAAESAGGAVAPQIDDHDVIIDALRLYAASSDMLNESRTLADRLVAAGDEAAESDPQAAERQYRHAAELADEYRLPYVKLGRLYLRYGRWDAAYKALTNAYVRGAGGASFEQDYGLAAMGTGRYEQAERSFSRAIEIDASLQGARVKLAFAKAHLGRKKEALALLDRVLAAEPDHEEARRVREMIEKMPETKSDDGPYR